MKLANIKSGDKVLYTLRDKKHGRILRKDKGIVKEVVGDYARVWYHAGSTSALTHRSMLQKLKDDCDGFENIYDGEYDDL